MENFKYTSEINELIETCKDGQKGFAEAAKTLKDPGIKTLFKTFSSQRAQFAEELQNELRTMGVKPVDSGSIAGAIHRGWIDVKSLLTAKDDHAIVSEAERGEDYAKAAYEKVATLEFPPTLKAIVDRQSAKVLETHNKVRDMKHSNHPETMTA